MRSSAPSIVLSALPLFMVRELLLGPGQVPSLETLEAFGCLEVVPLAHGEAHAHGIHLGNRGQKRGPVLPDEIPSPHLGQPRQAAHWRSDLGIGKIELGLPELGLGSAHLIRGIACSGLGVFNLLLADHLGRAQIRTAREQCLVVRQRRFRACERGTGGIRCNPILGAIDSEQQLSRLDRGAVLVALPRQDPTHASPDLGVHVTIETSKCFYIERHVPLYDGRDDDSRRRGRGWTGFALSTSGDEHCQTTNRSGGTKKIG
jgi:hypothetical protein